MTLNTILISVGSLRMAAWQKDVCMVAMKLGILKRKNDERRRTDRCSFIIEATREVDHTGQFCQHPSATSPICNDVGKKWSFNILFMNVIPNNFTLGTRWNFWHYRTRIWKRTGRSSRLKGKLPNYIYIYIWIYINTSDVMKKPLKTTHNTEPIGLRTTRFLTNYAQNSFLPGPMIGENRQLLTDEPVDFEK